MMLRRIVRLDGSLMPAMSLQTEFGLQATMGAIAPSDERSAAASQARMATGMIA